MDNIADLTAQAFMPEVASYLIYFVLSVIMVRIYLFIYLRVTPYDEFKLMQEGNVAAGIAFSGSIIGFSFTLAANAILHSSIQSFVMWAFIALLVQIFSYFLATSLVKDTVKHIKNGNVAMGLFIAALSVVFGIVNVGALS